ncbi:hypothetical protein [uncultured Bartonella sp.]|uniref:hypothetical protein n=1 Tax=uncultured Bartonella sp. TaxID=104108 RepID=UPI0025EF29EA|nr:hypothetical protein [uncultured Bartonella sp.]
MINLDIRGQTEPISIKASLSPEATTPAEPVVIKPLICDKFADISYYGQKESGILIVPHPAFWQ